MEQFEKMEEYLDSMTDQIRNKRAKELVAEEISRHIEDQRDCYKDEGDDESTAMVKALKQMGDPVEVGKQLDKIHRPRLEWRILLAVLALCSIGALVQLSINRSGNGEGLSYAVEKHLLYIGTGFLLMVTVYFLDYSFIGRYPKIIWFSLIAGILIYAPFGRWINGQMQHLYALSMLFIPAYGGILYAYRRKGYSGLVKCILFSLPAVILELQYVEQSAVYLGLLLSCQLMLFAAVSKNWFGISKRKAAVIITAWLPAACFILLILLRPYQLARLCSMVKIILHPELYEKGYQMALVRSYISSAGLFGGTSDFLAGYLPGMNNDFILTYVFCKWGIAAGVLIIALFVVFTGRMVYISLNQKNSLGMFVGLGCSLVFAVQGSVYILANLGIRIVAQVVLPFVSYGGTGLLINFLILGIMMSVFRNKDILKEVPCKAKEVPHMVKVTIKVEKDR